MSLTVNSTAKIVELVHSTTAKTRAATSHAAVKLTLTVLIMAEMVMSFHRFDQKGLHNWAGETLDYLTSYLMT